MEKSDGSRFVLYLNALDRKIQPPTILKSVLLGCDKKRASTAEPIQHHHRHQLPVNGIASNGSLPFAQQHSSYR
jgi:hypothetical protein